jgi:hypothetical protein
MRTFLKIGALLALVLTVSACAVSPGKPIERTQACSTLDPALCGERVTIADKQGVSTLKVVRKHNVTLDATWVDESSTAEQDMALTVVGAVAGPLTNGIVAHSLKNRSSDCGDGGCGGGQQVVQVQVDTSSVSTSGTSQSGSGCTTCAGRKKLPSM